MKRSLSLYMDGISLRFGVPSTKPSPHLRYAELFLSYGKAAGLDTGFHQLHPSMEHYVEVGIIAPGCGQST